MFSVHIRWMIRRDMPEVLAIETKNFEWPWAEEDFIRCLRQRNCIGMVAEYQEKVVGFMIYELHKDRLVLLNFAVHPDFQHRTVGTQMVSKLKSKLSSQRRRQIEIMLRESNLDAQLFFKEQQFKARQVFRGQYHETDEDAYLMIYRLPLEANTITGVNRISNYMPT